MKYIKTYESFNYEAVNEELFQAIKDWFKKKREENKAKLEKAIKENPEAIAKIEQAKKEFTKLPQEDKERITEIVRGENLPDPKTDPGGKVEESSKSVVMSILKWFGLSAACISFIGLLVSVITIAVVGTGFLPVLGGLTTLGNLIGILMGTTFVTGMIGAVGASFGDEKK